MFDLRTDGRNEIYKRSYRRGNIQLEPTSQRHNMHCQNQSTKYRHKYQIAQSVACAQACRRSRLCTFGFMVPFIGSKRIDIQLR